MTGAIPNFQAAAGGSPIHQARQKERARKAAEAKGRNTSEDDSVEFSEVEHADAVREAEHATSEEAREDHTEHRVGYDARGGMPGPYSGKRPPRIDVEG